MTFKKMTKVVSWLMTLSMAVAFAVPSVSAWEGFPTRCRYEWVEQSGTKASDNAHEHYVNAGDTISMYLTVKNRNIDPDALVMFGKAPGGTLIAEDAPWEGGHEFRIGVKDDEILSWIDASSFMANPGGDANRFDVYDGPDANVGEDITFNWDLKIADDATNGTYNLETGIVREYDNWPYQVTSAGAVISGGADIFWRVIVGEGTSDPAPDPEAGDLAIALSSGTPPAATIADDANANFTKFTMTAATGTTIEVSEIYVTRTGLTTDSQIENVKILNADGVQIGSTAGGFNANHKAQVFINPALEITGSMDFYIRAGIVNSTTAGVSASLGIAENVDIVSNATSVTGASVYGNAMTVVQIAIGSITLSEVGSITDSTPDVGDTRVLTNTFKLVAGSVEAMTIERITVLKQGTAETSDTSNVELYDDTNGVSLGTVAGWTSDGKASWPVNLNLGKGESIRFSVYLDIKDGASLTVNTDASDGSDALVIVKGQTYGFYITPTYVSATWNGKGDADQTINSGALAVSKSSTTPATGNIAIADDQLLAVWDFNVTGEQNRISSVIVRGDLNDDGGSTTITYADMTNARLVDMATGNILSGPVDGADGGGTVGTTAVDPKFTFSNTFVLSPGITEVGFKVKLGTDWEASDTIAMQLYQAADVTTKGVLTNNTITPTGFASAANTMTVKAGALVIETLGNPSTSNVIVNATDLIIGTYSFNAVASGEDVNVTALTITDDMDATTGEIDDFINWQLWADLTDANHATRGDKYETAITNVENESAAAGLGTDTISFTFTDALEIPKGEIREVAVIADVASGATALGTHIIETTTTLCATASGEDTGSDIAETTAGLGINATLTVAAVGSMKSTLWDGSPEAALIIAGTEDNVLGGTTFTATDEAFEITKLTMDLTAGYDSVRYLTVEYPTMVDGVAGTDTTKVPVSSAVVVFDGIKMYVPKNDRATAKFTVETWGITSAPGSFRDTITLVLDTSAAGEFVATGQNSGDALTGTSTGIDDVTMSSAYLHKTALTVSPDNAGLGSTIIKGGVMSLYKFKVTADTAAPATIKALTYQIFITDSSTTTASAADLTNFTFLKNGVDITSTSQITSISTDGGSNYLGAPLTLEATNYVENNESTWVQVTFDNSPVNGGEQSIDAGATVTYTLCAEAGAGFTTNDVISTSLLEDTTAATADAFYLNDADATTGVEQIIALQTAAGATDWADVEFIWSDKSVLDHLSSFDDDGVIETSSADWTNGYLVKNFPVASFSLTL